MLASRKAEAHQVKFHKWKRASSFATSWGCLWLWKACWLQSCQIKVLKKSGKIFTSKCCVKAHFHAFQCGTQIIGLFLNVYRHGKLIYMIDYVRRKHSGGFFARKWEERWSGPGLTCRIWLWVFCMALASFLIVHLKSFLWLNVVIAWLWEWNEEV